MPIYEYRCGSCQQVSEFMLKFSDPHPQQCPQCQSTGKLSKLLSQTGFILQGGGWFKEGYKGKSNEKAESKSAETKPSTEPSSAPATASTGSSGKKD